MRDRRTRRSREENLTTRSRRITSSFAEETINYLLGHLQLHESTWHLIPACILFDRSSTRPGKKVVLLLEREGPLTWAGQCRREAR